MRNIRVIAVLICVSCFASSAFARVLKQGMQGSDVKAWQLFLNNSRNIDSRTIKVPVTGKFGAATKSATIKFQKEYFLKQTGELDKMTFHRADRLDFDPTSPTGIYSPPTAKNKSKKQTTAAAPSAKERNLVLFRLHLIASSVEEGVAYNDYKEMVSMMWRDVVPVIRRLPNGTLKTSLSRTIHSYTQAGERWERLLANSSPQATIHQNLIPYWTNAHDTLADADRSVP